MVGALKLRGAISFGFGFGSGCDFSESLDLQNAVCCLPQTLNIRPDDEDDVGRDGIGGGIEEEDDDIVDVEEACGGVSTPTRFDQYFRFCLKISMSLNLPFYKSNPTLPVENDEGGHHGDVQHEDDDDDDDERAVRAADVGRVAVVAAAVLGREVSVARRLRIGRALGEVTRSLQVNRLNCLF